MKINNLINKAIEKYDFCNLEIEFIRHNENITYKVIDNDKSYVLRIHAPTDGFNLELMRSKMDTIDLIKSEIELLQYLSQNGNIQIQNVKLNIDEKPITFLDNKIPVTVLEWIEGRTLEDIDITSEIAHAIGVMIGNLHNCLMHCNFARIQNRYYYGTELLENMINEVNEAYKIGHFDDYCGRIIIETLAYIRVHLERALQRYIIVHADLGKSNLIFNNGSISPIDFSLSGYCVPEMDIASVFSHFNNEAVNHSILDGYRSISKIELSNDYIDICFCLQILLFIVIQHNKMVHEAWFKDKLKDWCIQYFEPMINNKKMD